MAIIADQHLHSSFSGDSETPMEKIIEASIQKGLKAVCFTEHQDFLFPVTAEAPEGTFELSTDSYLYELLKNRARYQEKIKILFGVELGLQPSCARMNLMYQKNYEFDFIIGSSHLCNGRDPYYSDFYEGRTEREAFEEYFSSIIENIKSYRYYDVYGHLDYIARYCPSRVAAGSASASYSYADYQDQIDEILKLLLEEEKGIEVNTSNYAKGILIPNPCIDILKRYHELGGEILTIGSDSHNEKNVAAGFDLVSDMLKSIGFRYYSLFENRLPENKLL